MNSSIKKLGIFILSILILGAIILFVVVPLSYEWYHRKISPFFLFSIKQQDNIVKVIADAGIMSGQIIQTIDQSKKKIIFTLTGSTEQLKLRNEFPVNGLIGYDMCYENQYGQYCFGETK